MPEKKQEAVLVLDVGGTTVDGGVVTAEGELVGAVESIASPEDEDADRIIDTLVTLLEKLRNREAFRGMDIRGVGIGWPGYLHYEKGICITRKGGSVFRALTEGKNIKVPIEKRLGLPIFFLNDADAFALGVWRKEHPPEERLAALTLGTGLGAGFIVEGRLAEEEDGAPPGREIFDTPYRGAMLEDAVSRYGIEDAYQRAGGETGIGVREIAERARKGEEAAQSAFGEFADALGEGLALASAEFKPTRVVFGGQITKAFDLFGGRAQDVFAEKSGSAVPFEKVKGEHLALFGAAQHAFLRLQR